MAQPAKEYTIKTLCYSPSAIAALEKIMTRAKAVAAKQGHRKPSESTIVSVALVQMLDNLDVKTLFPH